MSPRCFPKMHRRGAIFHHLLTLKSTFKRRRREEEEFAWSNTQTKHTVEPLYGLRGDRRKWPLKRGLSAGAKKKVVVVERWPLTEVCIGSADCTPYYSCLIKPYIIIIKHCHANPSKVTVWIFTLFILTISLSQKFQD